MDEYVYFDLKAFISEFKKNLKKIVFFIFSFVALTLVVLFLIPNEYESTVVLTRSYLIYLPKNGANYIYKPMEFYKNFVLNTKILREVGEEAFKKGILSEKIGISKLEKMLSAELFYKPISAKEKVEALKLFVQYKNPIIASKLVNLWGDVVIRDIKRSVGKNLFSDITSTIKTYEGEMEKIRELKELKSKITKEYTLKIGEEKAKWDRKIGLFKSKFPIDLWQDEVSSYQDEIISLQSDLGDVKKRIGELKSRVKKEKDDIEKMKRILKLNISTDDRTLKTLLGILKNKKDLNKKNSKEIFNLKIEKLNPTYLSLLENFVNDSVELKGLQNKAKYMEERISFLNVKLKKMTEKIAGKKFILDSMTSQENAIVSKLNSEMQEKLGNCDIKVNLIKNGLSGIENLYLIAKKIKSKNFCELNISLKGTPSDYKVFPPRFLITVISFLFALFCSILFIFFKVLFRE